MNLRDRIRELLHLGELDDDRKESVRAGNLFKHATYQRRGGRRHRPYTKPPLTGESKKRRKMAAKSRRINRR